MIAVDLLLPLLTSIAAGLMNLLIVVLKRRWKIRDRRRKEQNRMSWETFEREEPCFCGKSTITQRWKTGDWPNQFEDLGTIMDCPKCAKIYEYKVVGHRCEDWSSRMAWVKKPRRRAGMRTRKVPANRLSVRKAG